MAFRANPEAIAISRARDGKLIDVNDRWLGLFGHERSQAIGRTGKELGLYFGDSQQAGLTANASPRSGVREQELDLKTRGGMVVNGAVSTEAIDLDGEDCISTMIRDVTEVKRANHMLRRNDERIQLVLRATNDVIFDWKVAGDRLWWNDNGEPFLGRWSEERSAIANRRRCALYLDRNAQPPHRPQTYIENCSVDVPLRATAHSRCGLCEQLNSDSISLIDRQCAPIAGDQFDAAVCRGCRDERIVCGASSDATLVQPEDEIPVRLFIHPQPQLRKPCH